MGTILLAKNVVLFAALALILARFIPQRARGWKVTALLLLIGISAGVVSTRRGLDDWMISHVRQYRKNPADDVPARYVLGDFIPAKKLLGGGLPEEVRGFLTETAGSKDRCLRAMARNCLGEAVNVNMECDGATAAPNP